MSSVPVFKRVLLFGGLLAAVIAIVGSVIGYFVAGGVGVISALIGTAIALVFLGVTSASIIVASRYDLTVFFGIVMGAWLLKFVVFLALLFLLRDQPWIHPQVLFFCLVAAVLGTLVVDVVVIARSRMPYVSDIVLPDAPKDEDQAP
ncbi:hypothetical protein FB562_1610 [Homoserinimonas aerilata]|uniref:ATP synthase protein I n=1 Tax=Homoserinimonas aerilata TaxID=1162970 RepID=A0A542YK88_9MICO|nr:hypothetical protein [Homoserinimonas aerilata]TQL48516.1 hypothetical protein FB562_1610 [Homoserinimonas aerilata]